MNTGKHIAIFGPTGYIGTKMLINLYNEGHRLSLFSRNIRKLSFLQDECMLLISKEPRICVIEQFLEARYLKQVTDALMGVDVIYYFIHSLNMNKGNFTNKDNQLAELIAKAANAAGVQQIIYLGGLGVDTPEAPISPHLKSRQETAEHFRMYHPCVTEFRAGVIIGAGSASFEIVRNLGTKLPFLPQLPGYQGLCQPIYVNDVACYLAHALCNPLYYNQIAEIGSEDIFRYSEMLEAFAWISQHKKLKTLPLPLINKLLTPSVIAWFAARMTPLPYVLIEPLVEGMHSLAIVGDHPVERVDPGVSIVPIPFKEAVFLALERLETGTMDSVWSIPYELSVFNAEHKKQFLHFTSKEIEGMLYEECSRAIGVDEMSSVFECVKQIGGKTGYYSPRWLWEARGFIDKLFGGPGLSPSRRRPDLLRVGDRLDFWVVTFYKNTPDEKILRLKAKMLSPGNAWLQFVVKRSPTDHESLFNLRAYFEPSGIWGYVYWYSLYFIHKFIFKEMAENIVKEARRQKHQPLS
ncbi:MAG TPA: SDR family oxidoreductase [Epsilonproteobacteria bacterium]|nr:SDR family oxidoreductase [Campylobacterota bacterium]